MPIINPSLPPNTRATGSPDPAGDMDMVSNALTAVISAVNSKVETVNGKAGLAVTIGQADISGLEIHNYYNYSAGAYPTRPVTSAVVVWVGPVAPTIGVVDTSPEFARSDRWIVIP